MTLHEAGQYGQDELAGFELTELHDPEALPAAEEAPAADQATLENPRVVITYDLSQDHYLVGVLHDTDFDAVVAAIKRLDDDLGELDLIFVDEHNCQVAVVPFNIEGMAEHNTDEPLYHAHVGEQIQRAVQAELELAEEAELATTGARA